MPHPLPVIANVFRVAYNWKESGTGQAAVNVIHILDTTATATPADIASNLDAATENLMWSQQVPTASVVDLGITPLDGVHATQHFAPATPGAWVGQNGADWTPDVAIIIKLSTGLRGRSHRGRMFLPFCNKAVVVAGAISGGTAGNYTTAFQEFMSDLNTGAKNLELVVASYKLATAAVVTSLICEQQVGTQRRRQGRLRGG
jgi:hypothetical protein